MIVFSASAIATLACQGCVQMGPTHYSVPSTPVQYYEVSKPLPTIVEAGQTSLSYTGEYITAERPPRLNFEVPDSLLGPLELITPDTFAVTRLYSSATLTNLAADREQDNFSPIPRETRNLSAEVSLSASAAATGLGFDVGVSPRVSFIRDGAFATRRIGGEVRIGQNFDKRGEGDPGSSWYLFAGGDGEALVWAPATEVGLSVNDMALRDKVTVGDVQAGVSFQRGLGQVSLSYIRREVEYRERNLGASENEDFAGVTFTIRR